MGKRTCVILAIGEQERQIQNQQVLSISSKSGEQKKKNNKKTFEATKNEKRFKL